MEKFYEKTRALLKEYGVTDDEAENFIKDLIEIIDKDKDGDVSDDVAEAKEEIAEEGKDEQTDKDRVDEDHKKAPSANARKGLFSQKKIIAEAPA